MKMIRKLYSIRKRAVSLVLCAAILAGLLPTFRPEASAASTEQETALSSLVSWGIMRGDTDGKLHPERYITRAEFASLLNRMFGYTRTGSQPFSDVRPRDWFYEDISIAHTAGYFQGTSNATAAPNATVTREQAATLLCRNLMLQPIAGEDLSFTDSHLASSWSRGYIRAASEKGILRGDPSGTFRPLHRITRGEVAIMLTRVIGTPIREPGTYSNSVSGNMMISTSGVTLENMTITGDLYITGGVGLGYVTLNNVKVYGRIIASGAGESNQGDCSIILKNCSAPEMIVDSLTNQYVTIRTLGNTDIQRVYIRTHTYIEGKSTGRHGFQYIEIDGEPGTRLDLSGNTHEVVTVTPNSRITVGGGTVEKMTIDEHATNSTVQIDQGAVIEELNLDTATRVTGAGDIGILNVNAPGCIVEMLPDIIVIRPGITATINGIVMDSTLAQQMSDTPRILSGYPRAVDVAPNSVAVEFQTNKPGTIYWAIRLSGDGALTASELISPPSYGAKIVKSGSMAASNANTTLRQSISGLQLDTSYVLSAVLVDGRKDESIVKSVYFTTPDNSTPAFASGYPKRVTTEDTYVIFDVAATKTCTLHWAVYKQGMPAPTANDFKDSQLNGAIDSGSLRVRRNEEDSVFMGSDVNAKNALQELTPYDAYFFLTDGINESRVIRVQFTTADRTPPEFVRNYPRVSRVTNTNIVGEIATNEAATIYWAVVSHGTHYPVPNSSLSNDKEAQELDMKLQIRDGLGALSRGNVRVNANTVSQFTLTGLQPETAYDVYFVAVDSSGNYSEITSLLNAKTYDATKPTVEQIFSDVAPDRVTPLASTDITLVFSEDIYDRTTRMSLVQMYNSEETSFETTTGGKSAWADLFKNMFTFRDLSIQTSQEQLVKYEPNKEDITVRLNELGQTEVTFTNNILKLQNGREYQFTLINVSDSSRNDVTPSLLPDKFTVLDAQVNFADLYVDGDNIAPSGQTSNIVDSLFSMIPFDQTAEDAPQDRVYDLLIGSDTSISFELYRRDHKSSDATNTAEWTPVTSLGTGRAEEFSITKTASTEWNAFSYNKAMGYNRSNFPKLASLQDVKTGKNGYDYALKLVSINGEKDSNLWDTTIKLSVYCVTATPNDMQTFLNIPTGLTNTNFTQAVQNNVISSIGNPEPYPITISRSSQSAPQFRAKYPQGIAGDSTLQVNFALDRSGELFYLVIPKTLITPSFRYEGSTAHDEDDTHPVNPDTSPSSNPVIKNLTIPDDYNKFPGKARNHGIVTPVVENVLNPNPLDFPENMGFRYGSMPYNGSTVANFTVNDLTHNTDYYIFFALKGSFDTPSKVMCYEFKTQDLYTPMFSINGQGTSNVNYTVNTVPEVPSMNIETMWSVYLNSSVAYPAILDRLVVTASNDDQYPVGTLLETTKAPSEDVKAAKVLSLLQRPSTSADRFDAIATDSVRMQVWTEALAGSSSAAQHRIDHGSREHPNVSSAATVSNIVDQTKLKNGNTYIVILGAMNTSGGLPAIRAITGIKKTDIEGPRVTRINVFGSSGRNTFKGSIVISFDRELYAKPKKEELDPVPYNAKEKDVKAIPSSDNVKLVIDRAANLVIEVSDKGIGPSMFTIAPYVKENGDDAPDGSNTKYGDFQEEFCDEYGTSRTDTLTLLLDKNEDGKWICTLPDGTTSEVTP